MLEQDERKEDLSNRPAHSNERQQPLLLAETRNMLPAPTIVSKTTLPWQRASIIETSKLGSEARTYEPHNDGHSHAWFKTHSAGRWQSVDDEHNPPRDWRKRGNGSKDDIVLGVGGAGNSKFLTTCSNVRHRSKLTERCERGNLVENTVEETQN